jgi:hypothetical protein
MAEIYPTDPWLDAVAIFEWGIDAGIFGLMNTAWGWPIAEIVHFFGLTLLIGSVGLFDLAMLGLVRAWPLSALHRLVPFGVIGFLLSAASGTLFVVAAPDQYLYNPAFQIKLGLIGMAGINLVLFTLAARGTLRRLGPDEAPPPRLRIFAAVSLVAWFGVIAAGRVITAFRPPSWFWCGWCE